MVGRDHHNVQEPYRGDVGSGSSGTSLTLLRELAHARRNQRPYALPSERHLDDQVEGQLTQGLPYLGWQGGASLIYLRHFSLQ